MARIVSIHAFSPSAARLPAPSAPSSLPSLSYRRSRFYIFLFLVLYHRYCTSIALSNIPLDNRSLFPFHDSCRSILKNQSFHATSLFPLLFSFARSLSYSIIHFFFYALSNFSFYPFKLSLTCFLAFVHSLSFSFILFIFRSLFLSISNILSFATKTVNLTRNSLLLFIIIISYI